MTFRVGLIGNRAHQMTYAPILQAREDCTIVALAEHHPEKAKPLEERFGLPCAADYDAVLEDPDVDIVSIATDFYLKRRLIVKAIACGKHILVDKALARTVREAQEISEAAEDAPVKIVLSYPFRYDPALAMISRAIRNGEFGRIVSHTHHFVRQFPDSDLMSYVSYPTPVRVNGGGELMNLGSHAVDYLYSLYGRPRRVYCHVETAYWEEYYRDFGTEDMATLFCEYDTFAAIIITGRNRVREEMPGAINTVDITGEGRWVRVDVLGPTCTINGKTVEVPAGDAPRDDCCVQHLIDCITDDLTPETGVPNGVAVAEITTAAYQSAMSGDFVALPLQNPDHPMIESHEQVIDVMLD